MRCKSTSTEAVDQHALAHNSCATGSASNVDANDIVFTVPDSYLLTGTGTTNDLSIYGVSLSSKNFLDIV